MKKPENIFKFVSNSKKSILNNNINNQPLNIICKNVCVFTNARDEKHIREWAAHHLLIGFDKIIIFDHKSKTPLKEVFKGFDKRVKIIDVSDLNNPIKLNLMGKAIDISNFLKMDWMIYLDADEFIILNKYKNIKELLSVYNHADSLAINWLMFGSNFLKKDPDGLIIENYTKSELYLDKHVKTFVRPEYVIDVTNPHYFVLAFPRRMLTLNLKNNTTT